MTDDLLEEFLDALGHVRIKFWTCPDGHSDRTNERGRPVVTVEWRGDVAHCTFPGCGRTSNPTQPAEVSMIATEPSPWAADNPPTPNLNLAATFYGCRVDDSGEDGDAFILGHVGKHRAVAVFARHIRENRGDASWGHRATLNDALKRVEYLWMTNRGSDDLWLLREADSTDPGAFPVTWWDA